MSWNPRTPSRPHHTVPPSTASEPHHNQSTNRVTTDGCLSHTRRLHKPHLPHVIPSKYFDLYPLDNVSLPPNAAVPQGFLEENWHANGNMEMVTYANNDAAFNQSDGAFGFHKPVNDAHARELRRGYFAASTFVDAQVGRILDALDQHSFADNTVVAVWSDHG